MWVLNKLIYGSSAGSEVDEEVLGEQLETQQVEDWVVVNSPGECWTRLFNLFCVRGFATVFMLKSSFQY